MEEDQQDQKVTRDQFTRLIPVAAAEAVPPPPRCWSGQEWAAICQGHRSCEMGDHWDAFVEHDRLFLHRSWTGFGIYEAQFARRSDGWSITELLVCGDRSHYRRSSDAYEALYVEATIDGVLFGKWDSDAWTRLQSIPQQ